MKKLVVIICLINLITENVSSQELIFKLNDPFSKKSSKNEIQFFSDQKNGNLMIFFKEDKMYKNWLLDSSFNKVGHIQKNSISKGYKDIIGYDIKEEDKFSLYFCDKKKSKFGVQIFDFSNKIHEEIDLDINLRKELFVESITFRNQFYLITITKHSSTLNFYTFDKNYSIKKKTVSLKDFDYPNPQDKYHNITMYYLLVDDNSAFSNPNINLEKINLRSINSLETASKKNKLFQTDDKVIFAFNNNRFKTKLCTIDLIDFNTEVKTFDSPLAEEKNRFSNNSFVFEEKLFQASFSRDEIGITISDIKSEQLLKKYNVRKEDSIWFKNSQITQKGTQFSDSKEKEIETTDAFLKKLVLSNIGISVFKKNNIYNILLGGTDDIIYTSGRNHNLNLSGNTDFARYAHSKMVYVTSTFNNSLVPVINDTQKNYYDRIIKFSDSLDNAEYESIFEYNDMIIYGYYSTSNQIYNLFKFE